MIMQTAFLTLFRQPVKEKENSTLLCLKIDLGAGVHWIYTKVSDCLSYLLLISHSCKYWMGQSLLNFSELLEISVLNQISLS